jgi:hypothetical protein
MTNGGEQLDYPKESATRLLPLTHSSIAVRESQAPLVMSLHISTLSSLTLVMWFVVKLL